MLPEVQAVVEREVNKVVARFQRARVPADPDDMRQEAWAIAAKVVPNHRPDGAPLGWYLQVALRRKLGNAVSAWVPQVSIGKLAKNPGPGKPSPFDVGSRVGRLDGDHLVSRRGGDDDAPEVVPDLLQETSTPEDEVLATEKMRHRATWTIRARRAIESRLSGLDEVERWLVERRHGLDGLAPADPKELARVLADEHGWSRRQVEKVLGRFIEEAQADFELRALGRQMDGLGESPDE